MTSYRAIADSESEAVSDAVCRLTGHTPTTFAEFLSRHPEGYRHLVDRGRS